MKRNFCLAATIFAACMFFSACTKKQPTGDLLSQIKAKGEIIVATEGVWQPWTYHDEHNVLVGFDVDVAKMIAEKLGVTAKFAEVEWDGIFAGIDSKRYDITLNGVEVTQERAAKYDFSEPYAFIHTALIVRKDNIDIKGFEDLRGKISTNSLGSTYEALAEKYGAKTIVIDTLEETMQLVEQGRADATLNADVSFYDFLNAHPEAPLKVVALTKEASQVSIPCRKGDETATLRAALNKAIEELRADGTLAAISEKYFGKDISH